MPIRLPIYQPGSPCRLPLLARSVMAQTPEFVIFVGSLPSDITEEELQFVFKAYGNVKNIRILKPEDRPAGAVAPAFVFELA
eukprot:s1799_g11.t1